MIRTIHPIAGTVAILTVATFWLSTVLSEVFGSDPTVTAVKTAIPWGFLLLVPALAATGGSGSALAKGQRRGVIGAKLTRMPLIAANAILVLIPAALFLASKARAGKFDAAFYAVQAVELVGGAATLAMLGLSMRDGMKLTQWRRGSFLRPAPILSTSLVSREEVANGTVAFHLKKPDGFEFSAGQAIYMTLPTAATSDDKGQDLLHCQRAARSGNEMIVKHVGDATAPIYYVAGPPVMVSAMETLLRDAGVKSEDVRAEMFSGY